MLKALVFQAIALVVVSVGAWALSGKVAMISAFLGGVVSLVPNALFALRLHMVARANLVRGVATGGGYAVNFFMGEFMKVAATVGLLAVVVRLVPEIHWLSFLLGLAATLHSGFFAFWKKS